MRENTFGVKADTISLSGTLQQITGQLISLGNESKPGGRLPIDMDNDHTVGADPPTKLSLSNWDTSNNNLLAALQKIMRMSNGPQLQFRPYLADSNHVRLRCMRGHPYLDQPSDHYMTARRSGGVLQNLQECRIAPSAQRIYATGAGTGAGTVMALSQDLSTVSSANPRLLRESTYADSSIKDKTTLKRIADGLLAQSATPSSQFIANIDLTQVDFARINPGEQCMLAFQDHPALPPDFTVRTRILELSGDQSQTAQIKFEIQEDLL
jgi:hypothetical protein